MKKSALIIILLFFGNIVLASPMPAGFAPHSVWLSKSDIVAGDQVNIFTVLYNSSNQSITGDLEWNTDGTAIGTKNFTLLAGETQIESIPWTAIVGSHLISAKIGKVFSDNVVSGAVLVNQTTDSAKVTVTAPLPASKANAALQAITSGLGTVIGSSTPLLENSLASLYDKAESLRTAMQSAIQKQMQTPLADSNSQVKPISSSDIKPEKTAGDQVAAALLSIVSSKPLFYATLIISFLVFIQLLRMFFKARRRF